MEMAMWAHIVALEAYHGEGNDLTTIAMEAATAVAHGAYPY